MGAGNALRWTEEPERLKLDEIFSEIVACTKPDGYLMAVPKEEFGTKEYPHYVRIWLTYGLTAATLAGNQGAFALLRRWQDWFNSCDDLPAIKYLMLAFQGVVASTYLYNTPIGRPEDIDVTVRYYEEDWRHSQFINRKRNAIHIRKQPGEELHLHGTEIEAMEGYLDLYRATGKHYYLRAVQNFYSGLSAPPHNGISGNHTRRGAYKALFTGMHFVAGIENTWGPYFYAEPDPAGAHCIIHIKRLFEEIIKFNDDDVFGGIRRRPPDELAGSEDGIDGYPDRLYSIDWLRCRFSAYLGRRLSIARINSLWNTIGTKSPKVGVRCFPSGAAQKPNGTTGRPLPARSS